MFEDFLRLYEQSKVNSREPQSLFAETDLFNEGWLLRGVLARWHSWAGVSRFPFLPFPTNAIVRSSSQLYTPFKKRKKYGDNTGEHNTRADAVAGHYVGDRSKSGMNFMQGGMFFSTFEGKMYSGFSGIKKSKYSQLARTAACMVHAASSVQPAENPRLYLVTLYPADNMRITPAKYTKEFIQSEIKSKILEYNTEGAVHEAFERTLEAIWNRFQVLWIKWEEVVEEINDPHLRQFYPLCKRFGKTKTANMAEKVIAPTSSMGRC